MVTTAAPPLIFTRGLELQSMTRTLPYTAKYNSSLVVTGPYKYSTRYLTNTPSTPNSFSTHANARMKGSNRLASAYSVLQLHAIRFGVGW
jgi:hypothetical protein